MQLFQQLAAGSSSLSFFLNIHLKTVVARPLTLNQLLATLLL